MRDVTVLTYAIWPMHGLFLLQSGAEVHLSGSHLRPDCCYLLITGLLVLLGPPLICQILLLGCPHLAPHILHTRHAGPSMH